MYFFFPSKFILNCFKHSARSCKWSKPQAGGRGTLQGSQAGLAGCDAAAEQCSQAGLTHWDSISTAASSKSCVCTWDSDRGSIVCTEILKREVQHSREEGGAEILWSVSFPAGGLVLRAEGHHRCSSFCQRWSLCFFLCPKHILGDSLVPTKVHCSSPSLSHCHLKGCTSLKPHELLALGFHSGIHRSQATKYASYKHKEKRGKRDLPQEHTAVVSSSKN